MTDILYMKIVSALKQSILKGEYKPGDKLDSESSLMKTFGTTKITIRKSLALLCNEGFIYSVPSKGYFVQQPQTDFYRLTFNKFDRLNTHIDSIKLLSVKVIKDTPSIYIRLMLTEENSIVEIRRILLSEGAPIAFEKIYTKYTPQSPIVEKIINFANYAKMVDEMNTFNVEKRLTIKALQPTDEISKILELKNNEIVYEAEETTKKIEPSEIITYSQYYVNTRFLSINAVQEPTESGSSLVF